MNACGETVNAASLKGEDYWFDSSQAYQISMGLSRKEGR